MADASRKRGRGRGRGNERGRGRQIHGETETQRKTQRENRKQSGIINLQQKKKRILVMYFLSARFHNIPQISAPAGDQKFEVMSLEGISYFNYHIYVFVLT